MRDQAGVVGQGGRVRPLGDFHEDVEPERSGDGPEVNWLDKKHRSTGVSP